MCLVNNIILFAFVKKQAGTFRSNVPAFGGECGIRTHVRLLSNGFQDFPRNPTLTQNNRKYQTVENAENPDVSRAFGVLSFPKFKTPSGARISVSKTISKTFLEKSLDKSAPISPVASHIITAKSATTDEVIGIIIP